MRPSRSDQRPRGRYNGNRPFGQQQRAPNQNLDSNGPNGKIRGSAQQIFERYVGLAREAAIGGDPVAAENLYQHAEHYFRVNNVNRDGDPRPTMPADTATDRSEQVLIESDIEASQPCWEDDRPGFV
jgi:uncharacterized protein DUF4167